MGFKGVPYVVFKAWLSLRLEAQGSRKEDRQ